tara:strand:+ start:204 stop:392 length:189 start_codon:yes stop_codon:yes gene_type:complete
MRWARDIIIPRLFNFNLSYQSILELSFVIQCYLSIVEIVSMIAAIAQDCINDGGYYAKFNTK